MKYGMNLLLWTDALGESHLLTLESLKRMGYDGVELPLFAYDVAECGRWGKRLDNLGLQRTAVTIRAVENNPASLDAKVRAAGVAANKQAIDCCQAAGIGVLVGPFHSALGYFSGAGPTADEWKAAVDSMREVAEHAARCHVTLAVEYLNRFECYLLNSASDTARFVRDVNHPSCRMMYDTFHANIEEKNVPAAIRTSAPLLAHVHISENDRSTPGKGLVDWPATFATLKEVKYDGWLTVEAFGLALPAIAAATKIWRRMYDTEEQLAADALKFMKQGMA
ncbi:MAG: sugar phosphate isomerase/epimerase [Pirellulales bacterium]|nr:sugar phosphate isomerase/epimerase [Pirellulales bacterium]